MLDLNFFEGYIEKREFKRDKKYIYISLLGIFLFSLIGYTVYHSLLIDKEAKIVSTLQQVAENPDTLKKVEEIREKEVKVNEFKESVDKIKKLDTTLYERDKINEELLNKINHYMPNNVFLTSLSIQKGDIHIVGISRDKWSIAEFQKGLESLDNYEEIFVSHISLEEGYYNFALDITLRDVDEDDEIMAEATEDEGANEK